MDTFPQGKDFDSDLAWITDYPTVILAMDLDGERRRIYFEFGSHYVVATRSTYSSSGRTIGTIN
eukprot:scaffold1852_cov88-Cylindrotheca_fusiformis.AAC.1